jgi:hypothetical protein
LADFQELAWLGAPKTAWPGVPQTDLLGVPKIAWPGVSKIAWPRRYENRVAENSMARAEIMTGDRAVSIFIRACDLARIILSAREQLSDDGLAPKYHTGATKGLYKVGEAPSRPF